MDTPITYTTIRAAIFDVDDTLLSNYPLGSSVGLHERSRLAAAHEIGKRRGSIGLQCMTPQQCADSFVNASAHTLQAAVWQMLLVAGEVTSETIDPNHPLLNEIMQLKDDLHEVILRTEGREVPGATAFVQKLVDGGVGTNVAIASTAFRRDIDIFLEMTQLGRLFSEEHIISRERFTHAKPHPEAFNMAFAALGLPEKARKHVVAFEDDPRGIMSAKAAGLFTCAITTRYDKQALASLETPPDLIAGSYAEFEQLLGL
jgi:beta-phosphoglucomutase-like phosphatase (HAD superfamily)